MPGNSRNSVSDGQSANEKPVFGSAVSEEFEYRNYQELNGHPDYQAWIDSGGTIGFPGGEDQKAFCDRVQTAFEACIRMM